MGRLEAGFQLRRGGFELDAAFEVPARGVTALFGASGSGKTTLLRCVAGLERARGHCRIDGEVWQDADRFRPAHRRAVGYVFQETSLFPHLSVRRNLEYGWRRVPPTERRVHRAEAIDLLGIGPLLGRSPARLSGGERQRVAVARALLTAPRLLLMDEPLSALDQASRHAILPYLERLHDELAMPVLYVSHDPDEVARLADHMVLLEAGRVRALGPAGELLTRLDLPVAGFDDASAVIEGVVAGHDEGFHLTWIDTRGGRFTLPRADLVVGRRQRVRIHARDVSLALAPHHDTSILNILPATVVDTRDINPTQMLVRLALWDGQTFVSRITRRSGLALGIREGIVVYAQIKSVALVG